MWLAAVDIGQAERAQAMLDRNPYTAIIVGLGLTVVFLAGWIGRTYSKLNEVQDSRVEDRDAIQGKLDVIIRESMAVAKESAQAIFALVHKVEELKRELEELRAAKRRAPVAQPPKEVAK